MRTFFSYILLACAFTLQAQNTNLRRTSNRNTVVPLPIDTLAEHGRQYADSLQALFGRYQEQNADSSRRQNIMVTNPYYFPLFSVGTLYNRPLQQSFYVDWTPSRQGGNTQKDANLTTLYGVNEVLSHMYASHPELFCQTQQKMMEEGALVTDISAPIKTENKLADHARLADISHDVTDNIAAITRRPNFWTFRGDASLKFTQYYYSDNWYQGGDNSYTTIAILTMQANYDNKQKLQWENKLEAQLGFQTTKGDSLHAMKVTNNLLRLSSKIGYQAFKKWYYTARFQGNTQIYPNYRTNLRDVTNDFLSPLYLSLSVGMDYKLNKKRFEGSLYLAPVEVNARYVDRKKLRANYNDNEHQATKWSWGPNVLVNYKWRIIDNVTWQGRLYAFTNYHYTNVEMENTFSFNINKYMDCTLFVYPKYLDDRKYGKARNDPNGSYWMFKEWLSLGMKYSW